MSTQPIRFTGDGYGVEPCPGCTKQLRPGDVRVTVPGQWRSWHAGCHEKHGKEPASVCEMCGAFHVEPHDGSCLI